MKEQEERDRQERVRQRAYRLWEAEGRPEGRADVHWDQASELVAIEENQGLATTPVEHSMDNIGPSGEPIEPLEAVKNLGDFPTLRDQGEEEVFPHEPEPDPTAPTDGEIVGTDLTTGELAVTKGAKPKGAQRDQRDASAAPMRQTAGAARTAGRASTGTTGPASKPTPKAAAKSASPAKAQPANGAAKGGKPGKGKDSTSRTTR